MNTNFCIELSDDAAQDVSGGFYFGQSSFTNVNATIRELFVITKDVLSVTRVFGNLAASEAAASAIGNNTATQTISSSAVVQGSIFSRGQSYSDATSISATNGASFSFVGA